MVYHKHTDSLCNQTSSKLVLHTLMLTWLTIWGVCVFVLTYTDIYLALDGSFVERRVVPVVSSIRVGPLTQQQGHHLKTTHRTSAFTLYLAPWKKQTLKSPVNPSLHACFWANKLKKSLFRHFLEDIKTLWYNLYCLTLYKEKNRGILDL